MPSEAERARGRRRRDPYRDVERAQELTREGVIAQGELLRPQLLNDIGDTLGGMNSIGALRSGGTTVALGEISRKYTDRFAQFASAATLGAIDIGVRATENRNRQREARKQRKASLLSAIGGVIGAGVGFAIGGPPGAVAGANFGRQGLGGGGSDRVRGDGTWGTP